MYGVLLNTLGTDNQSQKGRQDCSQARDDQSEELIREREDIIT